jgi:hypothetical protein
MHTTQLPVNLQETSNYIIANQLNELIHQITGNIAHLFERFIPEGKCTIRLKSPSLDLILSKCDVMQLNLFLKTIKSGDLLSGGNNGNN